MDVQENDMLASSKMQESKRGSHVVENQGRLLKKRNDYGQKDNCRSINENRPGSQELNIQHSLADQFSSMGNLQKYNMQYPSQSKLQITNKQPSKFSQYDIIDSESSPKVPHFISNVETSKQ
jgi:hypothetical protein